MEFDGNFEGTVGPADRIVRGLTESDIREKSFVRCDMTGDFRRVKFRGCQFEECLFDNATVGESTFWNCRFSRCHFEQVAFVDSRFEESEFISISVSANYLRFDRVEVDAERFVDAIMANAEPGEEDYSAYRLHGTRLEVARQLLSATRDAADENVFYKAQRVFLLRRLAARRAELKWAARDLSFLKRVPSILKRGVCQVEELLTLSSGLLTNWGGSVGRPLAFIGVVTAAFFVIYWTGLPINERTAPSAFMRAVDISLVAGYSKYSTASDWINYASTFHLALGVYWYALIAGVLAHRVLR